MTSRAYLRGTDPMSTIHDHGEIPTGILTPLQVSPGGSPRWLIIARDALISLVCVVVLLATVLAIVGAVKVGNDLNSTTGGSSSSSTPDPLPTCTTPDELGCVGP